MLQRIRLAMETGSFIKSGGDFGADETFVGGKAVNMHKSRKAKTISYGDVLIEYVEEFEGYYSAIDAVSI